MDFSFTEDQEAICELADQIFGDTMTPERLLELSREPDRIDRDLWGQLAESNLLGVAIPDEFGGAGFGILELALVVQAQGRRVAPIPLIPTLVYGALAINEFGTDEQRKRLLPGVASGDIILSAALWESASEEPTRPRAEASESNGDWTVSGVKTNVPYAQLAHGILVPARTGSSSIGLFLVDPKAKGVTLERQDTTSHEPQFQITLADAPVAARDVLGDPKGGHAIVEWIVDRAMICLSASQLGVAEEAIRQTADYTNARKQFGKPIGSFQAVSVRAADAYIDVQAMRSTLWQAMWRLSEGLEARHEILAAKWWSAMGGHRVVHTAMHLHGGTGADVEYPIHRYFLWSKQNEATLGTAGHQLARLGELLAAEGSEDR